jgi:glycine cleavage system H protein
VIDRNDALVEAPEQLAEDPYGECWLLKVRVDDLTELDDAMSVEEYQAAVAGE